MSRPLQAEPIDKKRRTLVFNIEVKREENFFLQETSVDTHIEFLSKTQKCILQIQILRNISTTAD